MDNFVRKVTLATTFTLMLGVSALMVCDFALYVSRAAHGASGDSGYPSSNVAIAYGRDNQTATPTRAAVGAADSTTIATLTSTNTTQVVLAGRPNLSVDAVFTQSGQTCVVGILFEYRTGGAPAGTLVCTRWGAFVTLTGTAKPGPGDVGFATAPGYVWDTAGATAARIVCTTTAALGKEDFYGGTY